MTVVRINQNVLTSPQNTLTVRSSRHHIYQNTHKQAKQPITGTGDLRAAHRQN